VLFCGCHESIHVPAICQRPGSLYCAMEAKSANFPSPRVRARTAFASVPPSFPTIAASGSSYRYPRGREAADNRCAATYCECTPSPNCRNADPTRSRHRLKSLNAPWPVAFQFRHRMPPLVDWLPAPQLPLLSATVQTSSISSYLASVSIALLPPE
jgi:hypothetical protein